MTTLAVPQQVFAVDAQAMVVRHARVADAPAISALICSWSDHGFTLRRSVGEVLSLINAFVVVEAAGEIIACACVEDCGRHLGEVRSVAVAEKAKGLGAGKAVLAGVVKAADESGIKELYLLTKIPAWFERGGFAEVPVADLPSWWVRERVLDAGRSLEGRSAMCRKVP
ncbi:MAG: GNAT family N-acetyltransferase [Phycisphaerales bacterium]